MRQLVPTMPILEGNKSFYDFEQIDDLSNFAANVAQQDAHAPLRFVRGILNKHNLSLLQAGRVEGLELSQSDWAGLYAKRLRGLLKKLTSLPEYKQKPLTDRDVAL